MGAGSPLVLVHGWGGSGRSWDALRWPEGVSAVPFELPGHGSRAFDTPVGVRAAADSLVSRLRALAEPAVLVGHSLGGQVTTLVHTERPDLVVAEIVIDPAYGHPESDRQRLLRWSAEVDLDPHAVVSRFVDHAFSDHASASMREQIHADFAGTPDLVIRQYLFAQYFAADSIGFASDSLPVLARRTRATLGVYSTEAAADFERSAGDADLVVWPGFGHYLHLEAPAAFVRLVTRWLDRLG